MQGVLVSQKPPRMSAGMYVAPRSTGSSRSNATTTSANHMQHCCFILMASLTSFLVRSKRQAVAASEQGGLQMFLPPPCQHRMLTTEFQLSIAIRGCSKFKRVSSFFAETALFRPSTRESPPSQKLSFSSVMLIFFSEYYSGTQHWVATRKRPAFRISRASSCVFTMDPRELIARACGTTREDLFRAEALEQPSCGCKCSPRTGCGCSRLTRVDAQSTTTPPPPKFFFFFFGTPNSLVHPGDCGKQVFCAVAIEIQKPSPVRCSSGMGHGQLGHPMATQ
jgi:hypothetical protein